MENKVTTSSTVITYLDFFSLNILNFQTILDLLAVRLPWESYEYSTESYEYTKQKMCSGAIWEEKCIYYYIHLKITLSSQLLHVPLKRNHTNEKIFSSTKFLSKVKEN